MIKRVRKLKESSILVRECIITFAGIGAGRVLISILITLGTIGIPNGMGNAGKPSVKVQTPPRKAIAISSLNNWNYVWELFYTDLDGATRRSGKVLLFVSKKINKGAGYSFEEMNAYPKQAKGYNFRMDSTYNLPVINVYRYKQTALGADFNLGMKDGSNYFADYRPIFEKTEISYGSTHPDPYTLDRLQRLIPPIQAQEVSKLVTGMSYDQIKTRLKQDEIFRQQIKTAAGTDIWTSMQTNSAFVRK